MMIITAKNQDKDSAATKMATDQAWKGLSAF